ncbi:MAG: cation:proton antiporter [Bdellovibrionales bacterium]|nr:cation:proton antiporter [Bdellovibrionales bacterium]
MADEIKYFILIICVLLIPKFLLRLRIPAGITAIALGILTSHFLGWFSSSPTLEVLATLGVTSLFLFAGLEIDLYELKKDAPTLIKHVVISVVIIFVCAYGLHWALDLNYRVATILSLGLTTPSTGFILNSISGFKLTEQQKYWIRSKAIAKEVLALVILFFSLQSESIGQLSISLGVIVMMILVLPLAFQFFIKIIAPYAPDSEVTFMILMAFICGVVTMKLGAYYLIGAFIAGVIAAQFRHFIKTDDSEKMLYSISFFAGLLIPFYFFKAGVKIDLSAVSINSLLYGLWFLAIFVPIRYLNVFVSLRFFLNECWGSRYQISLSLMPTLIFGLVIASILRNQFMVDMDIINGLILYTIVASIIPSIFLKGAPRELYDPRFVAKRRS